jgi:hypothetical protein
MTLSVDDLMEIDKRLTAADAENSAFALLRRQLPHLSFTRCDASDVNETPFRVYEKFDIHLLDGADHCVQITSDPARATGIVLARRRAGP